ncbi:VOC family protein [Suttonella sp. R2A3]|uniref:VOC family protein n=1 Tax=Suttonella sp. R2A3 TaxID=2908648 RepID=UPI001F3A334C|nr:VOC family protein [Suttonella sp. R2A3]UJF24142.1 VOC family protein [Suttonella sp. R2A3]
MPQHESLNYIEIPATDLPRTKQFFSDVFAWSFTDYGEQYTAFSTTHLDGGFYQSEQCATTQQGSVLVVFYSKDLETTQAKIEAAGGVIIQPTFAFPGGRRFHFSEPSGNEFAVWSDK